MVPNLVWRSWSSRIRRIGWGELKSKACVCAECPRIRGRERHVPAMSFVHDPSCCLIFVRDRCFGDSRVGTKIDPSIQYKIRLAK